MSIFSHSFAKGNFIGDLNIDILTLLKNQLKNNDLLIETTWLHCGIESRGIKSWSNNPTFLSLFEHQYDRIFLYSGIDNEFLNLIDSNFNEIIEQVNGIFIGNSFGDYYFSFWLEFVYRNLDSYITFDPWDINTNISKFMCLNRKPHIHRVKLVEKLINYDLVRHGIVSLGATDNVTINNLYKLPILLSTDIKDRVGDAAAFGSEGQITNNIFNLGHKANWNNHFLNVVTETTIHSHGFISEKTLKPILGKRPFVVLGDRYVYNILHEWGIDTFDDLFGDGYNEDSYISRMNWVVDVIKEVSTINNLNKLLLSLKPRLEKNYSNLLSAMKDNSNRIKTVLLEGGV